MSLFHAKEYQSVMKSGEVLSQTASWSELENIRLIEANYYKKVPLLSNTQTSQLYRNRKWIYGSLWLGVGLGQRGDSQKAIFW